MDDEGFVVALHDRALIGLLDDDGVAAFADDLLALFFESIEGAQVRIRSRRRRVAHERRVLRRVGLDLRVGDHRPVRRIAAQIGVAPTLVARVGRRRTSRRIFRRLPVRPVHLLRRLLVRVDFPDVGLLVRRRLYRTRDRRINRLLDRLGNGFGLFRFLDGLGRRCLLRFALRLFVLRVLRLGLFARGLDLGLLLRRQILLRRALRPGVLGHNRHDGRQCKQAGKDTESAMWSFHCRCPYRSRLRCRSGECVLGQADDALRYDHAHHAHGSGNSAIVMDISPSFAAEMR